MQMKAPYQRQENNTGRAFFRYENLCNRVSQLMYHAASMWDMAGKSCALSQVRSSTHKCHTQKQERSCCPSLPAATSTISSCSAISSSNRSRPGPSRRARVSAPINRWQALCAASTQLKCSAILQSDATPTIDGIMQAYCAQQAHQQPPTEMSARVQIGRPPHAPLQRWYVSTGAHIPNRGPFITCIGLQASQ